MDPAGLSPREPEIEFLRRGAHIALFALRVLFHLLGLFAIGCAIWGMTAPSLFYSDATVPPRTTVVADMLTFVCLGVPLALPGGWTLGKGRWVLLTAGLAAWFGPMLVPGDHAYGFVLRFFASFVAITVLLVWRTLWKLATEPPAGP